MIVCHYKPEGPAFGDDVFEAIAPAIYHRGPIGEGTWVDDRVPLGYQQFYSTPESRYADLPCERNGSVITADSRLDNREALFSQLDVEGLPGVAAWEVFSKHYLFQFTNQLPLDDGFEQVTALVDQTPVYRL